MKTQKQSHHGIGRHPARVLGRIPDHAWKQLKKAAKDAGLSFTDWAVNTLQIQVMVDKSRRKKKT